MKLKDTFTTMDIGGDNILLDAGGNNFAGMIRNNETAAFIVNCLKQETTIDKIVDAMAREYNAPRDVIANDVNEIINTLRSINAFEE